MNFLNIFKQVLDEKVDLLNTKTSDFDPKMIKKGSKVVTRGGSGVFPKGLLIGYVEQLLPVEGKPLWEVVIRFSEDYRRLDRVYVIKNLFIKEQSDLEKTIPNDVKPLKL